MTQNSYSQYGQDRFVIDRVFDGKRGGVFIEIGAFDGVVFSNGALLERDYGWRGVCIEPLPAAFAELQKNRQAVLVNAAAGAETGVTEFEAVEGYSAMLSGRVATYEQAHTRRLQREQEVHSFARQRISVPVVRAADVLRENNLSKVDYASIDVEGGEFDCLRGLLDPDISISILSVENNYANRDVDDLLTRRGYVRVAILGEDDIYKARDFCSLSDHLLAVAMSPIHWQQDRKRVRRRAK